MKFSYSNNIKRLAIFFFYDRDGIVDDYIPYMLLDLRKNVEKLLVVCNGNLTEEGRGKFAQFTSEILVRENKGFDVWAYKTGMEYYGWEELAKYDEIILMNFTNMGPIYPFKEMFDEMSERDLDFWGITRHYGMNFDPWGKCKYGYIPMHIQSAFMVIRSCMIQSQEFQQYWQEMPLIHNYAETICWHEVIFTEDFTRKGFKSDTYVNTEDLKNYIDYPLMLYPTELIVHRKCPVFKRKTFFNQYDEFLDVSCGQTGYDLYKYLAEKTDYDLNFIWDTVLRTANMADIKERMQLNYILPTCVRLPHSNETPRIALFLHIYYIDQLDYCKGYASSMPQYADIYITTDTEEKKSLISKAFENFGDRKVMVLQVENCGREISAHFIALKSFVDQYDFICLAHDKKTKHLKPFIKGESFSYHCFENVLASPMFVENVIATFQNNPRLGLLVPPTPVHSDFSLVVGDEWQGNFSNVCSLAKRLNIRVDIDENKPPIAPLGGIFWYRAKALKLLFEENFAYNEFPQEPLKDPNGSIMHAIERIYPFVAQESGFYSGWVLADTYAKMEVTNLNRIIRDFNRVLLLKYGPMSRYEHMHKVSTSGAMYKLKEFILKIKVKITNTIFKIVGEDRYSLLLSKWKQIKLILHRSDY